ncbi:hypothetical protein [Paenibacillus sacheonensis]|uniref:Serine acetyltransferase n=1 Tax=Paenibacillus sacheonensis TaxID=742054 RepID=A0A7X4YP51_9BACL|nr:hypothetical protein [Paenibacillus sacheonensis]MBM7567321.1 serine O-acetyltransferase [Paenibacillus sacheonensis]NBC69895.1 hypothetical protein [Paenibacillus sacheonensis]
MEFRLFIHVIRQDYYCRFQVSPTMLKMIKAYSLDLNFRVVVRFRLQQLFFGLKIARKIGFLIALKIRNGSIKKYGIEIGMNSKIGTGLNIHHVNGIVIGDFARIGRNFNVYQHVTVGSKDKEYPQIGDNVRVFPGTIILGGITIGNNVTIGANSVVMKNVESNLTVAGTPAVEIKKRNKG